MNSLHCFPVAFCSFRKDNSAAFSERTQRQFSHLSLLDHLRKLSLFGNLSGLDHLRQLSHLH